MGIERSFEGELGSELSKGGRGNLRLAIACCLTILSVGTAVASEPATPYGTRDIHAVNVQGVRLPRDDYGFSSWLNGHYDNQLPTESGAAAELFIPDQGINNGQFDCANAGGNPIVFSTGNKIETEADFASQSSEMPLYLARTYNGAIESQAGVYHGIFGIKWRSNFDYTLLEQSYYDGEYHYYWFDLLRPDGRIVQVDQADENHRDLYSQVPMPPGRDYLIYHPSTDTFTYYAVDGEIEEYGVNRRITERRNAQGVTWKFSYDGSSHLTRVTHSSGQHVDFVWSGNAVTAVLDPAGSQYSYSYTANQFSAPLLQSATLPGGTTVGYHYDQPEALTGKSYNGVRYSTFTYSPAGGAQSSEHAGGVERFSFVYTRDAFGAIVKVVETNPLGKVTQYDFSNGKRVATKGFASSNCGVSFASATYDVVGAPDLVTDYNGIVTDYDYVALGSNGRNQRLMQKVEAKGTSVSRTTQYVWDAKNRVVNETVLGLGRTEYLYGADNRLAMATVTNLSQNGVPNQSRRVTYTYVKHPNGLLSAATVDGPAEGAGDAVTSRYDALGNLVSVENSLGHITRYSNYNALGLPGRVVGASGEVSEYTYDARGRTTNFRTYHNAVAADTTYRYSANGLLDGITTPDGVETKFVYDAARRLIEEYQREADGRYARKKYTYNNASKVTRIDTARVDAMGEP